MSQHTPFYDVIGISNEVARDRASTKRGTNVDLMLGQRSRRWPSIKTTLVPRLVLAGNKTSTKRCPALAQRMASAGNVRAGQPEVVELLRSREARVPTGLVYTANLTNIDINSSAF